MESSVDDSTLLTSDIENGGKVTNYDAIFGEPATNNKKYAKPTVLGNVRINKPSNKLMVKLFYYYYRFVILPDLLQ